MPKYLFQLLYIYRNPRDVAVSYYFFSKMLTYVRYTGSIDRFITRIFAKDEGERKRIVRSSDNRCGKRPSNTSSSIFIPLFPIGLVSLR